MILNKYLRPHNTFSAPHLFLASASSLCTPSLRPLEGCLILTGKSAFSCCSRNHFGSSDKGTRTLPKGQMMLTESDSSVCSWWKHYVLMIIDNHEGVRLSILHNICWHKALNYELPWLLECGLFAHILKKHIYCEKSRNSHNRLQISWFLP